MRGLFHRGCSRKSGKTLAVRGELAIPLTEESELSSGSRPRAVKLPGGEWRSRDEASATSRPIPELCERPPQPPAQAFAQRFAGQRQQARPPCAAGWHIRRTKNSALRTRREGRVRALPADTFRRLAISLPGRGPLGVDPSR